MEHLLLDKKERSKHEANHVYVLSANVGYGWFHFLFRIEFFEILEKHKTSHITVGEYVVQEAERQCFGSLSMFQSAAVCALLELGEWTNLCLFVGLDVPSHNGPH